MEGKNKIPCIRCLLEEIDKEKYEKDIRRILLMMSEREKAPAQEYERRLQICKGCEYLSLGTCNACGCFVELRAAGKKGRCPYHRWSQRRTGERETST